MKVYKNLDCELTIQSYGSTWLVILRGKEQDIRDTFNGLYNFKATNGKHIDFTNASKTIAKFWSSEKQMRKFFQLLYYFRTPLENFTQYKGQKDGGEYKRLMLENVNQQILSVRGTMETFEPREKRNYNPLFEVSSASAEKPDEDFKDSVLTHAHKDRSVDATVKLNDLIETD